MHRAITCVYEDQDLAKLGDAMIHVPSPDESLFNLRTL